VLILGWGHCSSTQSSMRRLHFISRIVYREMSEPYLEGIAGISLARLGAASLVVPALSPRPLNAEFSRAQVPGNKPNFATAEYEP
jgi:hypothetical protein